MAYEKYTVEQFMSAWFSKDYSVLNEEEFTIVYAEYQDTSGLFLTEDFEKQSFIHHLNARINYVKMFVRLQRDFIKEFDIPFIRDFEYFKTEYGHYLIWKGDLKDFKKQLDSVESREVQNTVFLEEKIAELNESRKNKGKVKQNDSEETLKKSRESFIRMLNSLGKIGYTLDKKTTTVEELALMVKQQMEEVEESNNKYGNR